MARWAGADTPTGPATGLRADLARTFRAKAARTDRVHVSSLADEERPARGPHRAWAEDLEAGRPLTLHAFYFPRDAWPPGTALSDPLTLNPDGSVVPSKENPQP